MSLIPPRSVVSTLDDGGWTPLRIVARLDEPLVADLHRPLHLDGPLAWCAYLEWVEAAGRRPPPIRTAESPPDWDLGLATWTAPPSGPVLDGRALGADGQAWGYACSGHTPVPAAHTAVAVRRKPQETAHGRYTAERRYHLGAGPYKARDTVHPAAWIGDITWWALGERARVEQLLGRLTHVGRLARHGYGRVQRIEVAEDHDRDGWRARAMPAAGGPVEGYRAPYHHATRRMPCRV